MELLTGGAPKKEERKSLASLAPSIGKEVISDNLLDAISFVESSSGTNPARLIKNGVGALGEYQIREEMFTDIQKHFPETRNMSFEDAALGNNRRDIAKKALEVTAMNLSSEGVAPTHEAVVTAYHTGAGNVAKGNVGDKGKRYFKDVTSFLNRSK